MARGDGRSTPSRSACRCCCWCSPRYTYRSRQTKPNSFTETLSRTDALYFTVTIFSTVGFGDIAPTSELARIISMTQMLMGLIVHGLTARIVMAGADRGRPAGRRGRGGADGPRPP
jgi:hypothetical protein